MRVRWWEGVADRSHTVTRIEFSDTTRTILPGIGTRFGIRAFNDEGVEAAITAPVRWSSSDTSIATVDSTGAVYPRAIGTVTIAASLAGWRSTARKIRIAGRPATVVLREDWDPDWKTRWIGFGDPPPVAVTGPQNVRALWTHGDGTYSSTAILRQAFSAKDGLGMQVRLSTPITAADFQRLRVAFAAGIDTSAYEHADQRKGAPSVGSNNAICVASYPSGAGSDGERNVAVSAVITSLFPLDAYREFRSGKWWTLRIQILPDGRCGFAINNRVIWISPEAIPLTDKFRVRLGDESKDTRLLHGPLEVWTGVQTDVSWQPPRDRL
jgi:hypothetical protein